MKKLSAFATEEAAVAEGQRLIHEGYVVVVTIEALNTYVVWATQDRTVLTGGWNPWSLSKRNPARKGVAR